MSEFRRAEFQDNGDELTNPGTGWVFHYYDNHLHKYGGELDAADTVEEFPNLANLYLPLHWSALEPIERVFDWSVVDGPAQRWLNRIAPSDFGVIGH